VFPAYGMSLKELWQLVKAATGFVYPRVADLEWVGERISTLARMFNVREGFQREADTLPERNLSQPMPAGPAHGQVVELEGMLDEYYALMGWDENGVPLTDTLTQLGLDNLINPFGANTT
jgi:aldehyde:ferredoxin oxidoreductase